jgi:hypothetical protein
MTAAYTTVAALTAVALAYAAYMNFVGHESVIAVAERVRVPQSWMLPLGVLLAAGALGLLVGFAVPLIGTAAAVGIVLYFCVAIGAHLRVRDYQLGPAAIFLSLGVATLALGVADRGPW